jgi:FAD/FMN-containing dehydrogenase
MLEKQIGAIVGRDNLITDPEKLAPYSTGSICFTPDRSPLMAARPGTVEEIKGILEIARLNKTPITPFSSETNGFGASIPTAPGITVDLRRLNRIHMVDEMARNAVIEPGVTYAQLQQAAAEKGLRVLMPVDIPSSSSVISTSLENAPLYAWPKYGTEAVLTLEILLSKGDLIKTGTAALPVFNEKPFFPVFTPPGFLNKVWFGSQGTFGIATKAAVKLKTTYENNEVVFIPFNAFAESFPAIKEIQRIDAGVEFFLANPAYLAGLLAEDKEQFDALKSSLPPVTGVLVLRGEEKRIAYQRKDLANLSQKLGFKMADELPGAADAGSKLLAEIEMPMGYERFKKIKGAYHAIPFICMAMQVPMFGQVSAQLCAAFGIDKSDLGELLLPVEPGRFHFQYGFYSDPANPEEAMKTKMLFDVLASTLIKMGGFFSRPYGEWAEKVYDKATAYKGLVKEFKAVIDPAHIMNPGKLSI